MITIFALVLMAQFNLPEGLLYKGKPIDAYTMNQEDEVNLGNYKPNIEIKRNEDMPSNLLNKEYIGYFYKTEEFPFPGYIYWKYIATISPNNYLIALEENAGGSGVFSTIKIIKREKNKLISGKSLFGGDRADGGIVNFKYENNMLLVEQYITVKQIFELGINALGEKFDINYDDLPDCPSVCDGGTKLSSWDEKETKFINIKLKKEILDCADSKICNCYNQISSKYIKEGKSELDLEGLKLFVKEIISLYQEK